MPTHLDPQKYRDLMRHQAGAVTLISTGPHGNRTGLIATAVCSLTDTPPTLLICVNETASAHDLIAETSSFCVNLLSPSHKDLVDVFTGKTGLAGEARFDDALWKTLKTGAPVLKNALASFDCHVADTKKVSTHTIYIGEVRAGKARDEEDPLVYFRGGFV
jgi:flavin reductase (DIM6/NTAB) family NADH-FMN oxidoreductase RutF